jgi:hypothetical protein
MGALLINQVEGNLTLALKISPVNVEVDPLLEIPVIEVTLPVWLRESIRKETTFGKPKARDIIS